MLTLALLQTDLHWENPEANRDHFSEQLANLPLSVDLVVLPEMFTTGFSMDAARLAEQMDGPTVSWMAEKAAKMNAAVTGSLIVQEEGKYFNRLVWMRPDGTFDTYDKRHLFGLAGEDQAFTPGHRILHITWRGWRICPMICYDLRFPVWCRNADQYDLLLFTANWPERRIAHWNTLLRARAIENQCYVAGLNRVGFDGNQVWYSGDSAIISPSGETVEHMGNGIAGNLIASIRSADLLEFRQKLPFLADRDDFELRF